MARRKAHGTAAKGGALVVHENLPFDELARPDPQAAASGPLDSRSGAMATPVERRSDGTLADTESAKALGRLGGLKTQLYVRILRSLGLQELSVDHEFYPYEFAGQDFADSYIASLKGMFDGECGDGPVSIVKTAGMQLAISRYLYDKGKLTGDAKLLGQASALGNDSRVSAGSAYELQSREAEARTKIRDRGGEGAPPPGKRWVEVPDGQETKQ